MFKFIIRKKKKSQLSVLNMDLKLKQKVYIVTWKWKYYEVVSIKKVTFLQILNKKPEINFVYLV